MIACLGDIHFRADKPYFIKICNDFIDWFTTWDYNNSSNTLILAGDLTEFNVNSGLVIDFLERFYISYKFKAIHICVGNHEKKKHFGVYPPHYCRSRFCRTHRIWNNSLHGRKYSLI